MSQQIISLLIAERDKINLALEALQGETMEFNLNTPPLTGGTSVHVVTTPRVSKAAVKVIDGRSSKTPEQRAEIGRRMKAYWAKKRRETK